MSNCTILKKAQRILERARFRKARDKRKRPHERGLRLGLMRWASVALSSLGLRNNRERGVRR